MGVEKGAAEPSNYALSLQSIAVPQPNSVFVSLFEDPPAPLDMSLKNTCFFVFLSKNPPAAGVCAAGTPHRLNVNWCGLRTTST